MVRQELYCGGMQASSKTTMKIAVIGSGVSGIGAVWALNEYSDHEVHLFESGDYLGGHTHTVKLSAKDPVNVDTGFIVTPRPQVD